MSMHLCGPWLSTTRTSQKKKKKNTKQLTAEAEHEKYLRKMGVHPEQREQKARSSVRLERTAHNGHVGGSNPSGPTNNTPKSSSEVLYNKSMAKPEPQVYSRARKLLGIATMHKSNMVPVFDKQSAEEIARMRR